ncbi:hypothetical protein A2533_04900 [Candidatus Falkowbacteria bacterium RIFOXYD2_FULL_35_9]|nr:MAG: hypothetical protein A2533_04900 [Candidatus Falkowbacteria bacterium RIFOXYD2_FULL_35_9]
MGYPPITKNLVYLSGLLMMLDSFTLSFWGVFRGGQNLKYEAFSIVISQVVVVLSGAYVLLTHQSLMFLMLPLLAGGLFNFVYSSIMVRRKLNVRYCWKFDPEILKFLFKIALPFALIAIFSRIYGNIDSVLLSYLKGDAAVGFYQTAMKVPFALQFIPSAFAAAIFPAFSYYFVHDKAKLKFSFDKAMLLLTIFVVPISFGLLSLSDEVIPMLFGQQFINSVLTLKILVFGLIFVFLNFPLGALLNGCDKQVTNTKLVGLVMALNIILNLIFIPQYSYIGAAAVFLVCHALLFLISLFVARKIIPYSRRNLILVFAKTILSAVIMTIAVLYLKQSMNLVLVMVIGAIIYIGVLYLVKGFSRQDMTYLKQSMLRK